MGKYNFLNLSPELFDLYFVCKLFKVILWKASYGFRTIDIAVGIEGLFGTLTR